MATKKMSKRDMDDHDDAHFSDNPAVPKKKRSAKRVVGGRGKKKAAARKSRR
jgi:hypothetical protein